RPDTQIEEIGEFASFLMVNNVSIYGGFDPSRDIRELTHKRVLEIDGNRFVSVLNGSFTNSVKAFHVVIAASANSTALLDGFTIQGGDAYEYTGSGQSHAPKYTYQVNARTINSQTGGGIFNTNSSATFQNLVVKQNRGFGGGGVNNERSSSKFKNVLISENRAVYGGGMRNYDSPIRIENSHFIGNYAYLNSADVAHGGGMANYASDLTLINTVIGGNYANTGGGGIYNNSNSNPYLINTTIAGNFAGKHGSGIFNEDNSNPTLHNTIVWGNNLNIS